MVAYIERVCNTMQEHVNDNTERGPEKAVDSSLGRRVDKNVLSSSRQQELQMSEPQPAGKKRKLRLVDTPWEERPVCRFFQEGKCLKVSH